MKVLWLTNNPCSALELLDPSNPRGGWLLSLEKELSNHQGIDLHVGFYHRINLAPFRHGNTTFHPLERIHNKSKIARFLVRMYAKHGRDKKEIEILKLLIEEVQPDIIHIHGTESNFGLVQECTSVPIVISIQGLINPISEKYFIGIPKNITRRYEQFTDKLTFRTATSNYRKLKVVAQRERQILKNARHILGRTGWDKAVTRLLSPDSKYFIGQEMLRPSFYKRTWHGAPPNGTIKLISVLGDPTYKGFEMIVKTARLLQKFTDIDFVWQVAGVNKDTYSVKIVSKWLNEDPEKAGIRLLGNQNEAQLANLLVNSDIYCQVSHIENSSNSLCEAMMVGIPCIASFAGGTESLLTSGKEGILTQEGDSWSLAGKIKELYFNFSYAKKIGEAAKIRASKRHEKASIVHELLITYREIIKTK